MTVENNDQTPQGEVGEGSGDQKVTIGGVEMTDAEAAELIESGRTMKELKTEFPDIDFKELPKAFTQSRQKLAELEKGQERKPEQLDAKEEARRKQIKEFFSDPLVKEEIQNLTGKEKEQLREDLAFEKTLESLESEFDGSDGRPKFDRKAVLAHGMKNQIFNPKAAYKDMFESELEEWKLQEKLSKRPGTTFVERHGGQGAKQPEVKTPTTFREASAAAEAAALEE